MLDVPEAFLEERRRRDADHHDEMWEGVLHMVPPPSGGHQGLGARLHLVLGPLAKARNLLSWYETGLFRPGVDNDYRVPDQIYCRAEHVTDRGVDGAAELVVEIRSPHDETYDKLDWYAELGVGEVLVLHPDTRAAELFVNRGGHIFEMAPDNRGIPVTTLGVRLRAVDGPLLRIDWDEGSADI